MRTKILIVLSIFLLFTTLTPKIQAQEKASGSSATLHDIVAEQAADTRVEVLKKYLEAQDSPLAPYASTFVAQADANNIDWKMLVAISGVESTFGKVQPCNNSWGWGISSSTTSFCFLSPEDGIRTISQTIRAKYMDEWGETDIYSIGHSYAASPTWADRVNYFMDQIQDFALLPENQPLSISL